MTNSPKENCDLYENKVSNKLAIICQSKTQITKIQWENKKGLKRAEIMNLNKGKFDENRFNDAINIHKYNVFCLIEQKPQIK